MYVALIMTAASIPLWLAIAARLHAQFKPDSPWQNSKLLWLVEFGSRWFLGLIMFSGGMSKLMPFPGVMGPVWLEEALEPHGLGLYARFIAYSEAIIGASLFFRKTSVLGAIMMVPLLINILMVTISLQWRGTPWVVSFFLVNNLYLLVHYFDRWKSVWTAIDNPLPVPSVQDGS